MSYLISNSVNKSNCVLYECTCGSFKEICDLYFCRYCLKLRCSHCLFHEVDSYFCSNCMENLPASEAKIKKNRCSSCFDCPSCFHTLSNRATSKNPEEGSSAKTPIKYYYLACFCCRWSTRDAEIPDQTVLTGNWPVRDVPNGDRLTSLLEYYKLLGLLEKNMKEKKGLASQRRPFTTYTDKFGLTAMMARKRAGLPTLPFLGNEINSNENIQISPAISEEEIESLPDHYYKISPNLTQITTISQRHADIMFQPEKVTDLYPQHRHFFVKRSLRCRFCEHNVSKPEYNPGSIKFKIQLSAYYHMPEVRIATFKNYKPGETGHVVLILRNPTLNVTSLNFSPLKSKVQEIEEFERTKRIWTKGVESDDATEKSEEKTVIIGPAPVIKINSKVDLPNCSVILPPRDDAADYGDLYNFEYNCQDDPKVVIWRKNNKAAVKFLVTPNDDLKPDDEVVFGMTIDYDYINTMTTVEAQTSPISRHPQRVEMNVKLYISPGKIDTA